MRLGRVYMSRQQHEAGALCGFSQDSALLTKRFVQAIAPERSIYRKYCTQQRSIPLSLRRLAHRIFLINQITLAYHGT